MAVHPAAADVTDVLAPDTPDCYWRLSSSIVGSSSAGAAHTKETALQVAAAVQAEPSAPDLLDLPHLLTPSHIWPYSRTITERYSREHWPARVRFLPR